MNKTLLTIIGVIIIVAVGYAVLRPPRGSDQQTIQETSEPASDEMFGDGGGFVQQVPEGLEITEEMLVEEDPATSALIENVSIDDTGFSPESLTVIAGTTVVFTNNGQAMHWPASDPHPTHTNTPGLDPKKGLATGETFSFAFDTPGTYTIHDHLAASNKATIIVQ